MSGAALDTNDLLMSGLVALAQAIGPTAHAQVLDAMKARIDRAEAAQATPKPSSPEPWTACFNRTDEALGNLESLIHALDALRQHHPDLSDNRPATEAIIGTIAAAVAALSVLWDLRGAEHRASRALERQQEDRA